MSNKTYDKLKFIAAVVLPALATLILTIFTIWGIPYGEAIAGTITAIDTFLGAVLKISSTSYNKVEKIKEQYEKENEALRKILNGEDSKYKKAFEGVENGK